ncbi:hypothetical protein EO92_16455 [Methanosarcina sp. 2.H.A.1B.4]|nr:hypothetical protein EO92_16455 [Methanosarcina sp. 2.H.A.1B.4]
MQQYAVLFAALKRTKFQIFLICTMSFAVLSRFCHARRRRVVLQRKNEKIGRILLINLCFPCLFIFILIYSYLFFFDRLPDRLADAFWNRELKTDFQGIRKCLFGGHVSYNPVRRREKIPKYGIFGHFNDINRLNGDCHPTDTQLIFPSRFYLKLKKFY